MSNAYRDNDEPAYTVSAASKKGRMSRNKGKAGEREAAKELSKVLGCEARRGVQYSGGPDAPDVVTNIPGLHVEVKRVESFNAYTALEQAEPIVLHRKNKKKWIVVFSLERFSDLCSIINKFNKNK
jgi:Holliday junction resolvase